MDEEQGLSSPIGRGIRGMAALIITSGFMGYMAMTMKDLLKGKGHQLILIFHFDFNFVLSVL